MYRPLDWVMVRAPLLPIEQYLALSDRAPLDVPADPRVRRALAVGAGDLWRAVENLPGSGRDRQRLATKLQRYLIRMASRPTPFGLFAGVGLAGWGDNTDLTISADPPLIRTRPDMAWLLAFVSTLDKRPEVRAGLRWFVNPAAFVRGNRVFLSEQALLGTESAAPRPVSVRASNVVREVLRIAQAPVAYQDLVASLSDLPGATTAKIERLLAQLWEQTLLLTDLRPPLTTVDPARHVADRLASVPAASAEAAAFNDLLDLVTAWDDLDAGQGADSYAKLVAHAHSVHSDNALKGPFQTDATLSLAGRTVSRAVAEEAANTADLLLRISPSAIMAARMRASVNKFVERYGLDRSVPLLELLDPELGLGAPENSEQPPKHEERDRTLVDLALTAVRDRQHTVELDEATIAKLAVEPGGRVAPSLDLSLFVLAASPQALDAGDFQVMVGPNFGAAAAGRVLGRFADLLGPEAVAALRTAAAAEEAIEPGRIHVEVTYLPRHDRSANVAIRPLVRSHEVVLNTTPGAADQPVRLADLVVGVHDDRFVIRWTVTGQEIVPTAGHMLNTLGAPAVIRFLEDVRLASTTPPIYFDWGPAAGFPFLPRITAGRSILAPATWHVDAAEFTDEWRERWQVPRHVYLTTSDNRLLLDLDDESQRGQLPDKGKFTLHEALPAAAHAWLPGPDGRYVSELVVPLVRAETAPTAQPLRTTPVPGRLRPPGSDWLFAKVYYPSTYEDNLLTGPIRDFCGDADWFFMRYRDPDPHLRIRWRGEPDRLVESLAPKVLRWGAELVADGLCQRFMLDTYDQEVERYGGPAAMLLAEDLFAADSKAVVDLLQRTDLDRTTLGMYTVDDLLAGLGFPVDDRVAFYRESVTDRKATAEEYRQKQVELRTMLGDPQWVIEAGIEPVLARRRAVLHRVADGLRALADQGELGQSMTSLAHSFVHMHCNRLLGCGHPPEQKVRGLLLRTRESLQRAALKRS